MKNTKKVEGYAEQSAVEFILAAQKSDKENANCSPELRAVKRLVAILGAWVNEPRTDEAWRFYQVYNSPCTNRMLLCSSDIQKTCDKLRYAGKSDYANEIKDHWQRIVKCTDAADDEISVLRRQYQQGGISKKVFAERVKREADRPRYIAAGLQGRLELIAKEDWQTQPKTKTKSQLQREKRKPVKTVMDMILAKEPSLANHEKDLLEKVNQKLRKLRCPETESIKTQIRRWRKEQKS